MPHALRARLSQPHGVARDQAIGQWLRQEYGRATAYNTVPTCVRYPLRPTRQVPRHSPRKTPGRGRDLAGTLFKPAAAETSRGPVPAATTG